MRATSLFDMMVGLVSGEFGGYCFSGLWMLSVVLKEYAAVYLYCSTIMKSYIVSYLTFNQSITHQKTSALLYVRTLLAYLTKSAFSEAQKQFQNQGVLITISGGDTRQQTLRVTKLLLNETQPLGFAAENERSEP